jgi:hypothetical protein
LCGWFIQCGVNGSRIRTHLDARTESQAIHAAHDLGFDEMTIWEYEQQLKTIRIPKGKHDFARV